MHNEWIKYGETYSDLQTYWTRSSGTKICLTVAKCYSNNDGAFETKLPSKVEKIQLQVFVCIVGNAIFTLLSTQNVTHMTRGMPPT